MPPGLVVTVRSVRNPSQAGRSARISARTRLTMFSISAFPALLPRPPKPCVRVSG